MAADITIQFVTTDSSVPGEKEILRWAGAALAPDDNQGEVTIRITDEAEMQSLNNKWRGIDKPTNVLSFPLRDTGSPMLGDLVVCAPVVKREAVQQAKSLRAHWAHMIIHGILHLMGYDHTRLEEAEMMQAKETALLQDMGFPDPYLYEPLT